MDVQVVGELVIEGKTKKVNRVIGSKSEVILTSKDDITAGDGAKHDVIPNKGCLANQTTCNVFRLLQACGLPIAFVEQDSASSFVAPHCTMLPYEVVVRREGFGSYLKRNPHLSKGQLFPKLLVEFFLKTSGKVWKGKRNQKTYELVCDDPFMVYAEGSCEVRLFDPTKPIFGQEPFLVLPDCEVFSYKEEWKNYAEMKRIARQTFLILEKAWQLQGRKLVDFKVEFGIDITGVLMLADVIDNDSWRVIEDGVHIDKQAYREGGKLSEVALKYAHVAALTENFRLPHQRIILWRGSDKDKVEPFEAALHDTGMEMALVTCSAHKEPVKAVQTLQRLVQEVPDCVVIAYIGRSNGAGPTLSAQTTVPVISVPASVKEFPEDAWSSLRMPSNVPTLTVLEPSNAVLAALNILSVRNPAIYARLRGDIEERTENVHKI
jgi:phosphoribosylaminoimidazole carboxylase/phosphoribosylaminoimidazole-succinocarboxamide synthase